ncbi:hypothetical protein GTQ34_01545 [Muricauda sp. JGD-17]|uniref:SGNH/GDSL hydrolase family protein n=1 Tax=Flagellimonas ochracea TaxID=2696472 RepID=A0A964T9A5_9FLAO|nr:hypothetical protein [Allomuricauda ochracea]NAY90589.1 hypothetical protein [Allomuricauda ochracea]
MIKLFLKSIVYFFMILVVLELLVRVFHLYPEDSPRYIDDFGVEKRVPHYKGYTVTGNRRQNFTEYRINNQGFNSYREFTPGYSKKELALIGDSFIQGFHQNYFNSIGKKIEDRTTDIEVYEYGYAGWDLADQLHLVHAYPDDFDKIDKIVIYVKYPMDFHRTDYEANISRIATLNSTIFKVRDNIKLVYYASEIGFLDPIKNILIGNQDAQEKPKHEKADQNGQHEKDSIYISNFEKLLKKYPIDRSKTSLLLDKRHTSQAFLANCTQKGIDVIDFGMWFEKSNRPVTLIYDKHWNNHGRSLVAQSIVGHLQLK